MWRLGRHDPRFAATMSLVVTFDGPLRRSDLVARLRRLCRLVPRLAQTVVEAPLGRLPPRWAPDRGFSVARHVDVASGPLWDVVSQIVETPFPPGRPPWRAVIAGSDPGELILHLHHSYTDGIGGLRLVAELFEFTPGSAPDPLDADEAAGAGADRLGDPVAADPPPAWGSDLLEAVEADASRAWSLIRRSVPWALRTVAMAATEPERLLGETGELLAALRTVAGAATGPASPLLAGRCGEVEVVPLHLDLARLRTTARRLHATVNDVFVAGLLDGLERYHAKHGCVAPSLRLALPISLREGGALMHNQVFGALMRGPLGRLDYDERVRLVHEMVLHGRHQPWAALVGDGATMAVRLPGVVPVVAAGLASLDVLASNVIGSPEPMWLGGSRVATMTPVGPRSGAAINATLLSYCGAASIGLNLDPEAVGDPDVLLDCLRGAFEEGVGG